MTPTYRLERLMTNAGLGWRVYLAFGSAWYMGQRVYKSEAAALQAAQRCGAVKEDR